MKILINGFHHKAHKAIIDEIAKETNPSYMLFLYAEYKHKPENVSEIEYLNCFDIHSDANYGVSENSLLPLDEKIISDMAQTETIVLRMMDRLSPNAFSYAKRKRLYLRHLRFWNDFFTRKEIDLMISSNIVHEVYDYIAYALAKLKGVKTIMMYQSQVNDSILLMNDWEEGAVSIKKEYERVKNSIKKGEEIKLAERFENDYNVQVSKEEKAATPFYMANIPLNKIIAEKAKELFFYFRRYRKNLLTFVKKLLSPSFWIGRLSHKIKTRRLTGYYKKHANAADYTKKYIYFPLHFQPELTTSPLAKSFVDQLLIAQIISYYLPDDVYIYLKEHPKQDGTSRELSFYEDLRKIKNLKLIAKSESSFKLSENALATATATGTAGWESIFRGIPVLMFGYNFYREAQGVYPIKTKEDVKHALDDILKGEGKPEKHDVRVFLKALENATIYGYIDECYAQVSKLSKEENAKNISKAIIDEIKRLKIN